ncbi:Transcription factor PERIANTHIA [Zea mays]|uniref:Transcription factor PERIANTHIA n=1 Tax=Zea mays TaxID=4577 RepID=A0A1D6LWH2_MAIZE|nr:Transcription factor PERIANTHIA [Zea mays]AQK83586.1 Transcription factor PERIANTHIA [Zea mays]
MLHWRCVGVRPGVRAVAGRAPAPHERPPGGPERADRRRRPGRAGGRRDAALRPDVPAQGRGHEDGRVPRAVGHVDEPAERFFMWLGGFRSSELLKVLARHVEPLTEQQLVGICGLQQSLQQAEDALSQGMEALQQALGDTLAAAATPCAADSVTNYMGQMAVAMSKLATVENFLRQADLLRQQTLKQVRRILTTRQAARALLVISDYFSRLRALSSLWLTRPTD